MLNMLGVDSALVIYQGHLLLYYYMLHFEEWQLYLLLSDLSCRKWL